MSTDLRYPIGPWERPTGVTPSQREEWIAAIGKHPQELSSAVAGLSDAQLDTPYRPGGWTVRQVVHHVADSHINAMVRFKLALTEDNPTIRPYDEARWAELADTRMPIEVSLRLLEPLHARWVSVLRALTPAEFGRPFQHPETGAQTIDTALSNYAWHGRHHTAHVTALRAREGW